MATYLEEDRFGEQRWQELTAAVAQDWPDHPNPLDAPAVLRRLGELAAQATHAFPSVRRQVVEDAPGIIHLAFRRFDCRRSFNPWARTVLYNHAVSLYRRQRRMRTNASSLNTIQSPLAFLAEEELAETLHDFRQLCDVVRFPLPTLDGPELAAVFALETRQRLLVPLARYGPDFLDSHLPLRDWERRLQVRRDWPQVGELWEWLAGWQEPNVRNADAVLCACRTLAPGARVEGLQQVWSTWVNRAKRVVERQLESHVQAQLFFYLFPSNRSAGTGSSQQAS